jgi:hypothetical protein
MRTSKMLILLALCSSSIESGASLLDCSILKKQQGYTHEQAMNLCQGLESAKHRQQAQAPYVSNGLTKRQKNAGAAEHLECLDECMIGQDDYKTCQLICDQ